MTSESDWSKNYSYGTSSYYRGCGLHSIQEMLFKIKSEVLYSTNEKLEKNAQAFIPNTVQTFLKIIRQRMEKPNMFAVRDVIASSKL